MLTPSSFITVNPLEDFSIRYANDQSKYVAQEIFPPHVVSKKTSSFYTYSKENLKVVDTTAPSGTEAPRGDYAVSTKTYTCKEEAFKGLVLEKDARDFDRPVADLDTEQVMQNMDKLLLGLETKAYTKISTTTNYPSALTAAATAAWGGASATPIEDFRAAREAVFTACGKRPNIAVFSQRALDYLKNTPEILDRTKYTGPEVTNAILARLFELEAIYISDAVKNTANEGAADSLSTVWGNVALCFYRDPGARLKALTFGKMFVANQIYTKTLDKPELARGLGAHEIETGMEYTLESCATVSSSDDDFSAGFLMTSVY